MKKTFLSVTFLLLIIFNSFSFATQAKTKTDYSIEMKYGKKFLAKFGYSEDLFDPIPLHNLENDIEAVVFSLSNGYIIININDLTIPEFSLCKPNPFTKNDSNRYYYNGPLKYYLQNNEKLISIYDNTQINMKDMELLYKKSPINKLDNLDKITNPNSLIQIRRPVETYEELDGTLRTWGTSHYCGVDGTAILLMYFDDYYDESFVATNIENANGLTNHLINNNYIEDAGTTSTELKNGIEDYLEYRGLDSDYNVSRSTYSPSTIKYKIRDNKPVLVGTISHPHPSFSDHWVIAHAYLDDDLGEDYLVVNDGFGSNDIYITTDSSYYDYLVYIY
jgi:hypothetical protein